MTRQIFHDWYQEALHEMPRANKNLGQHFIYDYQILEKISSMTDLKNTEIIFEIGPGIGGLTSAMLGAGARKIVAIEKDKLLAEKLHSLAKLAEDRLEIIPEDARFFVMSEYLAKRSYPKAIIIANLPYNTATYLLQQYLDQANHFTEMVLMFQREVACRLTARVYSGEYGRLSILAQARAEVKTLMLLPPGAFKPAPKVASSVVKFILGDLPDLDYPNLKKITSWLFAQRRKKIQTILRGYGVALTAWQDAPIDGNRRPETLTASEAISLTKWVIRQADLG